MVPHSPDEPSFCFGFRTIQLVFEQTKREQCVLRTENLENFSDWLSARSSSRKRPKSAVGVVRTAKTEQIFVQHGGHPGNIG
jgi:hypothetical protein